MRSHPFLPSIILGTTVAALAALMNIPAIEKADDPRVISPIVQLEFARSAEEVFLITGKSGNTEIHDQIVAELRRSIALDTWFILAYTTFLAVTIALMWRRMRVRKWILYGIPLAVGACIFDFLENDRLLQILNLLNAEFETPLRQLQVFTHIKWASLAAVFGVIAPWTWHTGWWGRFFSILAIIGFSLALLVWFWPYTMVYLAYAGVIALLFAVLWLWVILQKPKV